MHSSEITLVDGSTRLTRSKFVAHADPFAYMERACMRLHTWYLRACFPFSDFGSGVSIHYSCEVPRQMAHRISIGRGVFIGKAVWLNVVGYENRSDPAIVFGDSCAIGRNSVISAKNRINIESGVQFAPAVLVMDHNHEFRDIDVAIKNQGSTPGGTITIGCNSWIGYGAAIVCGERDLTIGRNCVVAANAVVTKSVPSYSVVAGNPAKVIRRYDQAAETWIRIAE